MCGKTHNGDAVIVDVSLLVELLLCDIVRKMTTPRAWLAGFGGGAYQARCARGGAWRSWVLVNRFGWPLVERRQRENHGETNSMPPGWRPVLLTVLEITERREPDVSNEGFFLLLGKPASWTVDNNVLLAVEGCP